MVQEYFLDRCRYLAGSLKPFILLLPKETTRIDYLIDNFKCEVRRIIYSDCIKIEGYKTNLNVSESVNNRLDFTTKVTLSMRENWDDEWISLINDLKNMNCYVVVEDFNGIQYIQSPEFISDFEYTFQFNSTNQGNIAELTYNCDSNMPLIILDSNISPTQTYSYECLYHNGTISDFRMTPYQYVLIDNNNETDVFTTITCTGGESLHKIEFTPETFSFRQRYDGRSYQETLVFRIPLSDYKYYFRYNLVEFKQNRYAVTFKVSENNWIASGFEFGFQPTYTVETSDNFEELNFIEITLQHAGQNSIFYSEKEPTVIDSVTESYVPLTQPIKDPVTGLELAYWNCLSKTQAIYTLVQMVTISGVPTDRYMCLNGFQEYYENFNIVGTYESNAQFGFSLTFSNSECATKDNCEFDKLTKEVYTFRTIGDYYEVHVKNPCPWYFTNLPNWINYTLTSGEGGVGYTIRFTSRENASSQRKISYATLHSYDNQSTIQFILENKVTWLNPTLHNITAMNQYVTSYVDLKYDEYEICQLPQGLTAEKMPNTSSVRIYVPENSSTTTARMFIVGICNLITGERKTITINQDLLYTRWEEDVNSYICDNGTSYKKLLKYKGYTSDNINILTDETARGAQLIVDDPNCLFSDAMYRWNTNTGETICQNGNKYAREDYEVSTDGGETWRKTGDYRIGELIEASSSDCVVIQYKWEVDYTRWICVGTTSYYYEVKYESTDGINWIKTDPEEIQQSETIRLQNDVDCGYSEPIYRWVDDGDNYLCVEDSQPPVTQTRWVDMPYSVYQCVGYDKYSTEKEQTSVDGVTWTDTGNTRTGNTLIEENSTDCGYVGPTEEWRNEEDAYICEDGSKYQSQIRYYWDGTWKTDGERRLGNLIENNSTDCVGVQSDTSGKMYLFNVCNDTYECVNNVKIFKATRMRNEDMQGLTWIQDSSLCSIDTRGVVSSECGNYANEYLTTEMLGSGTIKMELRNIGGSGSSVIPLTNIQYSKNNGSWTSISYDENITVANGDKIRWKADGYIINGTYSTSTSDNQTLSTDRASVFSSTVSFNAYGNVESLLYNDNFTNHTTYTNRFNSLFANSLIVDASNLVLSEDMGEICYKAMFSGCTSLVNPPVLSATTLAVSCYSGMFIGCTSLVNAPALPATTLALACYNGMFKRCTSLTTAPALPATTLTQDCYIEMFFGCTSLVNAPVLSATTLAPACYRGMFYGCTSLTTAPVLPATTLAQRCYDYMFYNCTSLTTAPTLPATTLRLNCYERMFYGCTSLNYIKAMFTTTPSANYTLNWVNGVAATGTFVKNSAAEWDVTGTNGIPSGWTVETASS